MKPVFHLALFFFLGWYCFPVTLSAQFGSYSIRFVKPDSADSYILHNDTLQTIEMFLRGSVDGQEYWGFTEENLHLFEIIGDDTFKLEVVSMARELNPVVSRDQEVLYVRARSQKNLHGELRTYLAQWVDTEDNSQILASDEESRNWAEEAGLPFNLVNRFSFLDLFFLGLTILVTLLLLLSEGIPLLRKLNFKRKYVKPFHTLQRSNERRLHPITGVALDPEEKVVEYCDREICCIPFSIWERRDYQCLHFPDICNGVLRTGEKKFFTQSTIFRQLNWLWFGALGGFLAWVIFHIAQAVVGGILSGATARLTCLGIGAGLGITFALSWVEERGFGGDFSWRRIIFRTLAGTIISAIIFLLGSLLIRQEAGLAFLWLFFCVALGAVLSFRSSIERNRGLVSGAIAGVISTLVYITIINLFKDAELALMLALVGVGATLGWTIMQVVRRMEKIELQVLSPADRAGTIIPLDKYLNAGERVKIGKDGKSCPYARIKWAEDDDPVLPQHIELFLLNNKVHLRTLPDAEVLVNNKLLDNGQGIPLEGGERIQLGRKSKTSFKYLQKN